MAQHTFNCTVLVYLRTSLHTNLITYEPHHIQCQHLSEANVEFICPVCPLVQHSRMAAEEIQYRNSTYTSLPVVRGNRKKEISQVELQLSKHLLVLHTRNTFLGAFV